jgi:hypothetical protein
MQQGYLTPWTWLPAIAQKAWLEAAIVIIFVVVVGALIGLAGSFVFSITKDRLRRRRALAHRPCE